MILPQICLFLKPSRKIGLTPAPSARTRARPGTVLHRQAAAATVPATLDPPHSYGIQGGPLLWHGSFASGAFVRAAPVAGPIMRCDSSSARSFRSLRSLPLTSLLPHRSTLRRIIYPSTRCLIIDATCRWPPALSNYLASAAAALAALGPDGGATA